MYKRPVEELAVGAVFAGYRIEGVAGRGGMGVVYRAMDVRLRRQVALKVIAPEYSTEPVFRIRFERECQAAASLRHPNVITIFHADEVDDTLFITMDYIDGPDLRTLVTRDGPLEPARAARIATGTGSALAAAHARGLVHRDVKPANILLAAEGDGEHPYLTDFGLTKDAAAQSGVTQTGAFVGTLDYIAPEQITADALDARTDVYALGGVLYHALTGQVPYPQEGTAAKIYAHLNHPAPRVTDARPGLDPRWDAVVGTAMAKDPGERYDSAETLCRAIAGAADGSGADAGVTTHVHARPAQEEPAPARDPETRPDPAAWVAPPTVVARIPTPTSAGFAPLSAAASSVVLWHRRTDERRVVDLTSDGRALGTLRFGADGSEAHGEAGGRQLELRRSARGATALAADSGAEEAKHRPGVFRADAITLASGRSFRRSLVPDFRKHAWEIADDGRETAHSAQVTHWLLADDEGRSVLHFLQPTLQRGSAVRTLLKARLPAATEDPDLPLLLVFGGYLLL